MSEKQSTQKCIFEGRLVMEEKLNVWKARFCRLFPNKFEYYLDQQVNLKIY